MQSQMRGNMLLLLTAFIWGTTFVAQMVGMDGLGPFTYASARFVLGTVFLYGLCLYARRRGLAEKKFSLRSWKIGLGSGLLLFTASSIQQIAMLYTTTGKTAFITALYIVLVPLGAALLRIGSKVQPANWLGALLALGGLYLLSIQGEISLNIGDMMVFVSAFFWTGQILFISRFAGKIKAIEMSFIQTLVCCLCSIAAAFLTETPALSPVLEAWFPIFYAGILSTGIAYTLQIVGQKYAAPSDAALIMSFEAVFGAAAGAIMLDEQMTLAQLGGCALMFAGIIVAQLPTILAARRKNYVPRANKA